MTGNKKLQTLLLTILLLAASVISSGCDWSAMWDLKRAEKILKQAEKLNAEFCGFDRAQDAYRKSQKALDEGMTLARHRFINEARDKAEEARAWAEEAVYWAQIHNQQIQREKDAIGTYKD